VPGAGLAEPIAGGVARRNQSLELHLSASASTSASASASTATVPVQVACWIPPHTTAIPPVAATRSVTPARSTTIPMGSLVAKQAYDASASAASRAVTRVPSVNRVMGSMMAPAGYDASSAAASRAATREGPPENAPTLASFVAPSGHAASTPRLHQAFQKAASGHAASTPRLHQTP
ncbi:unnamed protein product, partial [Polarella glacialis]